MRVLVIGGTRFIGPAVVDGLLSAGHEVTLFHRGEASPDLRADTEHVLGDRKRLAESGAALLAKEPEIVVDMVAMTQKDARETRELFSGHATRMVTLSSGDVYRAFGRVNGIEDGAIEGGELAEDAPLRTVRFPYKERAPEYDKILVEEEVMGDPAFPGTILRLPMVYGPGDYQHRFYAYIKRMDDKRPVILLETRLAAWRFGRSYVDNVARAVVLCVNRDKSAGRIYNVGEPNTPTIAQAVAAIGEVVGWPGKIRTLDNERCPEHLQSDGNFAQHIVMDTTKIREELGYREVVTRGEALARTVAWEREHPEESSDPNAFDYTAEDLALA